MIADQIINMLALKHFKDVFVPECKDGCSQGGHLRLDAWVMKKSWAHPLITGYEVKVSRSDFENDEKWRGYLPYCNEFYFVCPHGLIQPEELPDETGLMWVSKTGSRLYRKKKARYRTDLQLLDIYKYVIMCRSQIKKNTYDGDMSRVDYWQQWLEENDEKKHLGYNVSKKVRELVAKRIDTVECKMREVQSENDRLNYVKVELEKLGFTDPPFRFEFDRKLREIQEAVPADFLQELLRLQKTLGNTIEEFQKMNQKTQETESCQK